MGGTSITRYLPDNEYQAAISANAPTALNPFATIADISGISQNLQQVLSVGSGATITTNFTVYVFDNTIEFASDNQTSGDVATLLLDSKNPTGAGLLWSDGATGNERFLLINSSSMSIYDDFLKGLVYDADYSAAGVLDDRWIPDYAAVKAYADSVGGIYGGSDFLSVSTTVSLTDGVAANYDLTFATLTEAALVHYDSTNNRVGWGIAVPGHSLHFALGNAYFQNGSVAIGTTVPDSAHKFRVSTDNADGNNYTGARIDLSHDSATGVFQGLQIRSTTTLVGATSTLYGVNSNITGSATAGVHTVIAGRFKAAKTQAGTSTVTNYALQLEDGSEGTVGHVWASDTVTGHGHWIDVNTLISGGNGMFDASNNASSWAVTDATLGGNTTITMGVASFLFSGNQTTFKGIDDLIGNSSLVTKNDSGTETFNVRNNGSMVFGQHLGGVINNHFNFKIADVGATNLMSIEDGLGNNFYTFTKGQLDLYSANAALPGGSNSSEFRMSSIYGIWNTTIRAKYDGNYYFEMASATVGVHRYWTAGSKTGMVHLGAEGATPSVKIGGVGVPSNLLAFDVRGSLDTEFRFNINYSGQVGIGHNTALTTDSLLNVNGDIESIGSTNGLIQEDRLGGGNRCRIYVQEDTPGVFSIYTEPVP